MEKNNENVSDMISDVERRFHYRIEQEEKRLILAGYNAVIDIKSGKWCL